MPDIDELLEELGTPGTEPSKRPEQIGRERRPGRAQTIMLAANLLLCLAAAAGAGWQLLAGAAGAVDGFVIAMLLWNVSPYLGLAGVAWFVRRRWPVGASIGALIGTIAVAAFGTYSIYQAFGPGLDPQSALIFLFLPGFLWFGCVLTLGLASHARPLDRTHGDRPPRPADRSL